MYEDAGERDDRLSRGKVLDISRIPWGTKPPSDVNHPIAPVIERESTRPIGELTAQLATAMLDTMPEDLRAAAAAAYQASQEAAKRLNKAQRELSELSGPTPAGMSVEALGERHIRRAALIPFIEDLRRASEQIGEQTTIALVAARDHVTYHSGRQIHTDARAKAHAMREEADRLIEEAGRLEIATLNALGKVNAWLPTEAPRVAEPQQEQSAAPAPKRKRLFG